MNLLALPWAAAPAVTSCTADDCRAVAAKLAADHPGQAVHVVREEDYDLDPSARPVVWDTVVPKPQEDTPDPPPEG